MDFWLLIIITLPSQITTRRINFIVDNSESQNMTDHSDGSQLGDQEKDRSWPMSSLHQIYSRR